MASYTEENANVNTVQLLVSTLEYTAPDDSKRFGVCTRYLKESKIGSSVFCILKSSTIFQRSMEVGRPLIMIANGSGENYIISFRISGPPRPVYLRELINTRGLYSFLCSPPSDSLIERPE